MTPAHNHPHGHPDHICWGAGAEENGHVHPKPHELEVREISVCYRDITALRDLSFKTSCGRSVALVGPNGAGKSSLLKVLAGLIRPDRGEVIWRGSPLKGGGKEIAYVPQRGEVDWNFPVTVRGLVEMGRYPITGIWGKFGRHDQEMVDKALHVMGLEDLRNRHISELSGGQQQRAFLARALAQEAHVLLWDEPFTGLDETSRQLLLDLMRKITREGRLLLASHHDLTTVEELFDDVLLLNGRTVAFGPVAEVFTPENLAKTYAARAEEESK